MTDRHTKQRLPTGDAGAGGRRGHGARSGGQEAIGDDDATRIDTKAAPPASSEFTIGDDTSAAIADVLGDAGNNAPPGANDDTDEEWSSTRQEGRIIDGRYRILSLIGRGGMGTVYKAEHVTIRRTVALKLLHPTLAKLPEVSKRFEREAFAIGRIEHPNCVNVSDFGDLEDGSLFLVMEYIDGQSLGDLLAEVRRIEPVRTMHITRHVLRGLGHAHENGIVHRDVKPENVLLCEQDGDPDFAKILDFGIAKLIGGAGADDGGGKLTQAGVAFGTPIYMSPEQAVGNPVDGRADLYAASVMAYEMIAGVPPFQSDDKIEVMSMHTGRPPPPLAQVAPDVEVPPAIEQLIRRGLAKKPIDRYADAAEYIAALDAVIGPPLFSFARAGTGSGAQPLMFDPGLAFGRPATAPGADGRPITAPVAGPPGPGPSVAADPRFGTAPVVPGVANAGGDARSLSYPNADGSGPVLVPPGAPVAYHTNTSAQHALPTPRSRWLKQLVGAIAVAAIVGVAAAFLLHDGGGDDELDAPPVAEAAAQALKAGAPGVVISIFEHNAKAIAEDAGAQLQLGHAYAASRKPIVAARAYGRALTLDDALITDNLLHTNLGLMLDDDNDSVFLAAADLFLAHFIGVEDVQELQRVRLPDTVKRVVELASKGKRMKTRQRAREVTDTRGLTSEVDRVTSFSLDLVQGATCKIRRKAVARLRAVGDPRAIEALQRAIVRKGRRGRYKGRKINRCLRDDASDAIQFLESVSDPGDGAGPKGDAPSGP